MKQETGIRMREQRFILGTVELCDDDPLEDQLQLTLLRRPREQVGRFNGVSTCFLGSRLGGWLNRKTCPYMDTFFFVYNYFELVVLRCAGLSL